MLTVEIEADEQAAWTKTLSASNGMAGKADGGIDDNVPRLRLEESEDFAQQDGAMLSGRRTASPARLHGLSSFKRILRKSTRSVWLCKPMRPVVRARPGCSLATAGS